MRARPAALSEFDGPLGLQMGQGVGLISSDPVKQGPWVETVPLSKNSTVVDSATTDCVREDQLITAPFNIKTYPDVDFCPGTSPAQSASLCPRGLFVVFRLSCLELKGP